MSRIIIIAFTILLPLLGGVYGQSPGTIKPKLPVPAPATAPKPAPMPASKPAPAATSTIKFMSNAACDLYIDGEKKASLAADEVKKISLKPGEYFIKAVSTANNADVYKDNYTVEQSGQEIIYEIDLQKIIKDRLNLPQQPPLLQPVTNGLATLPSAVQQLISSMVYIPGGTFTMGCTSEQGSDCYSDETPAHRVTLSGYSIGKYEVTQAQWRAVMGTNPSSFSGCDNCPVEQVSWEDVQEFIRKLNSLTGKAFRLPTEAEWEYAARGGTSSRGHKYAGGNDIGSVAWYNGNSGSKTHPVGQKQPNELGLYDMSGNVWEWCSDWKGDYSSGSQSNPAGPTTGANRVNRGGSWSNNPRNCRVSLRLYYTPSNRYSDLGFRLVLSP